MGFDYAALTKDAQLRTFIKFTDEVDTIEGIIEQIDPLRPNNFGQNVYVYHIRSLENGIVSELSNGSGRLMKEFIRLNVEPGDTIRIKRTLVPNQPMKTTYEVEILEKGEGRKSDGVTVDTAKRSTPATVEGNTPDEDDDSSEEVPF